MGFLDKFRHKPQPEPVTEEPAPLIVITDVTPPPAPPPPVQKVEAKIADRTFHKPTGDVYGVRKGMWVLTSDGSVGILTNLSNDGAASVMLVNDDGSNKLVVFVRVASLKQARYTQIPLSRRPPADVAAQYGYLRG